MAELIAIERDDARAIMAPHEAYWISATWEELDRLESSGPIDEEVTGPSGRHYRLRTEAFWDTEPWESGMYVNFRVYGTARRRPHKGGIQRGAPTDQVPDPVPGTRWVKRRSRLTGRRRWVVRD
jgi:hypothetical protein